MRQLQADSVLKISQSEYDRTLTSNTTRIAKNTIILYFRHILVMLLSLYIVRVVLEALGAEDYGIYNVVSGVVVLFTFLTAATTGATQRFLNFALGQNDTEQVRNVYSISIVIHILIAVFVIILAQTAGLWFFNTWLNIPPDRQAAAFFVYQIVIATTVISILQIPYQAIIIAYEKMSFFAFVSIIESLLKLTGAVLLTKIMFDKLISYAFFICCIGIISLLIYKIYCNYTFLTARFKICKDKKLFKQIIGFSSWVVFNSFAYVGRTHGISILVNIFHGVVVNAALGISMTVNAAVNSLVSNFQIAFAPQITKSYAANNYSYFMRLIFFTSKTSFFLLFFFALPLFVNIDFVLSVWLKNVPEYTVIFVKLVIIFSFFEAIAAPLWMSIQATGNIKKDQLVAACFTFANLPISLLILWMGYSPVYVITIMIGLSILLFISRVFFVSKRFSISLKEILCGIILPILIITGLSYFVTVFIGSFFLGLSKLIISCVVSVLCNGSLFYLIGLNVHEKLLFKKWIVKKLKWNYKP